MSIRYPDTFIMEKLCERHALRTEVYYILTVYLPIIAILY